MKYILALLLPFFVYQVKSQSLDCSLLRKAVNTDLFKTEFKICTMDSTIVLFDKKGIINNCLDTVSVCDKTIHLSHDSIYNKLNPNKYIRNKYQSVLVLYELKWTGSQCSLFFWRPYSGANLKLTYKANKKEQKLISHSIGSF
jgi:hypothetical protein